MINSYTISLPLSVPISKKKFFRLNLNQYRNTHYFTLNKAKVEFENIVLPKLSSVVPFTKSCTLHYVYYPANKRLSDISNVLCVVDKFFEDTLVNGKYLPDDNYTYIKEIQYSFGHIDKNNPRVDVTLIGN